ncbi:MAG: hypothetical protein H7X71_04180 [Chitinophagales bacterium]|nr:hypothetical protein [Chitinophagales bacterium]
MSIRRSIRYPIIVLCALFLASCTKKEGCTDELATNFDPEAEKDCCCEYASEVNFDLEMHLHQFVGSDSLVEGNTYLINGVATKMDIVQFYISNIRLVDDAGNETVAAGTYLLAKPETDDYEIGSFPAASFSKIRFDVGIDSVTNHADPSLYTADNPLSFQSPSMHWSWSMGYIFLMVTGEIDTDDNGTLDDPMQAHLGKDEYLAEVEIDYPFTAPAGSSSTIHLNVDWALFWSGIDIASDHWTHVDDNITLANALKDNIPGMFSKEE